MAAMAAAIFGSIRTVTENRRWPGGSRGAKPPPVHADWPPGMRSPRTCAVVAANSPSASHLAAGSPQHPASLRPPSDQPAISMTALWQAHPAAQYNTALSWTCRRPAVDPALRRGAATQMPPAGDACRADPRGRHPLSTVPVAALGERPRLGGRPDGSQDHIRHGTGIGDHG